MSICLKILLFLFPVCLLATDAGRVDIVGGRVTITAGRVAIGPLIDQNLYFVSTGHVSTWTAPVITGAGASVLWRNPLGQSTNVLNPSITFFTNAGLYIVSCADWSKVASFSFYVEK